MTESSPGWGLCSPGPLPSFPVGEQVRRFPLDTPSCLTTPTVPEPWPSAQRRLALCPHPGCHPGLVAWDTAYPHAGWVLQGLHPAVHGSAWVAGPLGRRELAGGWSLAMVVGMGWQRDVRVTWADIVPAAARPAREPARRGEQLSLPSVPFGCCSRNVPSRSVGVIEKALAWRGHGHRHLLPPRHHLQHQPGNVGVPGAPPVPSHLILCHFLITAVISSTAAPAQHVTSLQ